MMNYPYYQNQFMSNQQMQPNIQPMMQPNPQPTQPPQDERIWVQGIEGANAYLVAPNSFVRLWDSQDNLFYEKHTDASGRPYTDVFEYSKKSDQKPKVEISAYESQLKDLEKRVAYLERNKGVKKNESNANAPTV